MKKICYLALAVILAACNQKNQHSRFGNEDETGSSGKKSRNSTTTNKTPGKKTSPAAPVISERVSSGTVLHTSPKGETSATLLDYVPLHCGPLHNGWYPVSIDIDITKEEYTKPIFRKGRKIKVNGIAAGVLEKDTRLPVATNGERMWATLNGYTEKKNIRSGTIIETALVKYLEQHKGRSIDDMQPFIRNFQLEEDNTLRPYSMYFNYESGIDDPSPLYRLVLVCQGKQLIGIVHSRPLELAGSSPRKMQRNFTVHFLSGIDKSLREDFCHKFNKFILSVD